jgi:hypothetical protein
MICSELILCRSLQVYGDVLLDVENKLSTMTTEHAHAVSEHITLGSMLIGRSLPNYSKCIVKIKTFLRPP